MRWLTAAWAAALLALIGCAGQRRSDTAPDRVTLQLKWLAQTQFAGYHAARAEGLYAAERLEVAIRPGGPDVLTEAVVARGEAEFGIAWLPSLLAAPDRGLPLVNIAQVFASSGIRQIARRDSGIGTPADLRGRPYGIDRHRDLTLVPQPFGMALLLQRKVDAAAAMTCNEYRQVLDAGVRPEDLVVIDFNREGTAMLEDGIFVSADWLRRGWNLDVAARFLRASLRGWALCRERPGRCVDIVLGEDSALGRAHQAWMMAEVSTLIWGPPAPEQPLGRLAPDAFARTADIALRFGVITRPATRDAYTHEVWERARPDR